MPIAHLLNLCLAGTLLLGCSGRAAVSAAGNPAGANANSSAQNSVGPDGTTLPNFAFAPGVGQSFSVSLASKMDGGYQWHLLNNFDPNVVAPLALGKSNTASRNGAVPTGGLMGAFAPEIFDFKGLAAGKTSLSFSLYRSFEGPDKAGAPVTFTVTVQ